MDSTDFIYQSIFQNPCQSRQFLCWLQIFSKECSLVSQLVSQCFTNIIQFPCQLFQDPYQVVLVALIPTPITLQFDPQWDIFWQAVYLWQVKLKPYDLLLHQYLLALFQATLVESLFLALHQQFQSFYQRLIGSNLLSFQHQYYAFLVFVFWHWMLSWLTSFSMFKEL